jgi:hypothetical protein
MTIIKLDDKLWIGGVADFGGTALNSTGIEIAVSCMGHSNFPHDDIQAVEFKIFGDGKDVDWYVRGAVDLLLRAWTIKKLILCDASGGLNAASFLIAATYAAKNSARYTAGVTWLGTKVPDGTNIQIASSLSTLGASIWA